MSQPECSTQPSGPDRHQPHKCRVRFRVRVRVRARARVRVIVRVRVRVIGLGLLSATEVLQIFRNISEGIALFFPKFTMFSS